MFQKIADIADDDTGFAHIAFFHGFAEIAAQGICDGLLIVQQRLTQFFQRLNPVFDIQRRSGGKKLPLGFHDADKLFLGHVDSSITS